MPPNTIYVGRPTKWGNPYRITPATTREDVIWLYQRRVVDLLENDPTWLDELKGKDLACWCPLDKSCHVDVLLEFLKGES